MATILTTLPALQPFLVEEALSATETGRLGSHTVHRISGGDSHPKASSPPRRSVLREWIEKNSPAQKAARRSEFLRQTRPLALTALSLPPRRAHLPPSYIRVSRVTNFTDYQRDKVALSFTQQIVIPL
jgi:hypothetical protein